MTNLLFSFIMKECKNGVGIWRSHGQKYSPSNIIDQRKILFWKKTLKSDKTVVHTLATINRHIIWLIMSRYGVHSVNTDVNVIKERTYLDASCR